MNELPITIKMQQAMKICSCSRYTIMRMIDAGTLLASRNRPGGEWIIPTNQPHIQNLVNPTASEEQKE